ncbi:MAG: GFA family protein [Candidatus Binatia bacterium]
MSTPFTGGCACGAIRYQCSAEPVFSWKCHCRDCQRASGSAYCPVLYVPKAALTITGQSTYYEVKAESGNGVSRGFCPTCGSPVFIRAALVPDLMGLWAASLDKPSLFQPSVQVWTGSAQPWDCLEATLLEYRKAPTEEQMRALLSS